MSANDLLVRIGRGRKLHLLATYGRVLPSGRAACGATGKVTPRWTMGPDQLAELEACPRCTETSLRAAGLLIVHDRRLGGRRPRG